MPTADRQRNSRKERLQTPAQSRVVPSEPKLGNVIYVSLRLHASMGILLILHVVRVSAICH
jgi:hypothetical protein